jgi:phospholipid N-methyltransferase
MKFLFTKADEEQFVCLLKQLDANVLASQTLNERLASQDPSLLREARPLDARIYQNNPYCLQVHPEPVKQGRLELGYHRYRAREVFLADDVEVQENHYYAERNHLGYFREAFSYLALDEKGTTWMSVIPHEINTMESAILAAQGNTYVVLGLGLGYFPFRLLVKGSVEKLIVVEHDPKLLAFFKSQLLPLFPHTFRLQIIEGDAYKTVERLPEADGYFWDLWHNEEDGLPLYEKALKTMTKIPAKATSFWMERGLLAYFRRIVIVALDEEKNHPGDLPIANPETLADEYLNRLSSAWKKKELRSYREVSSLLSEESLKEILTTLP